MPDPILSGSNTLYLGINDNTNWNDNYGYAVTWINKFRNGFLVIPAAPEMSELPVAPTLSQNYPNPFNPSTTISFEMPQRGNVQVNIYNSIGQLVRSLVDEQREPGTHSAVWDGKDNAGNVVASGSYFYQVQIGDLMQAKKMIFLK